MSECNIGGDVEFERRESVDTDLFFNSEFENHHPIYVEPGTVFCSDHPNEMLVSTVGSGVVLSIYESDLHMGAIGYVLLPDEILAKFPRFDDVDQSVFAKCFEPIESCIGAMKRRGAGKGRIRIRLMGGTHLPGDDCDKGMKSRVFVREYLSRKGLHVMNEDIGGDYIRRVHFFPTTGKMVRWMLKRKPDFEAVAALEENFQKIIASES